VANIIIPSRRVRPTGFREFNNNILNTPPALTWLANNNSCINYGKIGTVYIGMEGWTYVPSCVSFPNNRFSVVYQDNTNGASAYWLPTAANWPTEWLGTFIFNFKFYSHLWGFNPFHVQYNYINFDSSANNLIISFNNRDGTFPIEGIFDGKERTIVVTCSKMGGYHTAKAFINGVYIGSRVQGDTAVYPGNTDGSVDLLCAHTYCNRAPVGSIGLSFFTTQQFSDTIAQELSYNPWKLFNNKPRKLYFDMPAATPDPVIATTGELNVMRAV
jgi:hypothetical protein